MVKKFTVIIKIIKNNKEEFIKYRSVSNLLRLTAYLDKNFDWRYYNVFDSKTKEQIASFTKNNKPKYKWLI